jgi:fumarate hydratase subunit beta
MTEKIVTPLTKEKIERLKAGDLVEISGVVYAARDAAHKRMNEILDAGKPLPFNIIDSIIYYVGPSPAQPGQVIGSAGPTTSERMDAYTPRLIELGLSGMIGKGFRNREVIETMVKYIAIYFGAIGGAGALISSYIKSEKIIAFPELGPEAIRELVVKDFPAIVIIDSDGNNLYENEVSKYRQI